MNLSKLRAEIGPPEDIAVVGPRCSGQTTLALMVANWHRFQKGRRVVVVTETPEPRFRPAGEAPGSAPPVRYVRPRDAAEELHRRPPDVVIWDGMMPLYGRPCRVISTSEIF